MNKRAKVYLVGAGPGDLELLTLKAVKKISEADCIVYDRLVNPEILNFARKDAELIYLGKLNTEGGETQSLINKTLVEKAKIYSKVVRLKGGDSFVFGRGGEELIELVANDIDFEIIPGITSAISVPCYAGIPVTHRDVARSFHVFTGHTMENGKWHDFKNIAKLEGTLIFLMGIKNLGLIVNDLLREGKDENTPVAIIEQGSTLNQRVTVGILKDIVAKSKERNIKPPAIIVIGEVVKLREEFKWFDKGPLFSKKILITRDEKASQEISEALEERGAKIFKLPFIDIEYKELDMDISKYSCLLFNSPNGVRAFLKNFSLEEIKNKKIGAVGEKTKEILEENNIQVDFYPSRYMVDVLAKESVDFSQENDNILILTSDISPCEPEKYTRDYSRNFEKLEIYRTKKIIHEKEEVKKFLKEVDYITFLSSSTFEAFFESIEGDIELIKDKKIVSIGPKTSQTIQNFAVEIYKEAKNLV